MWSDDDATWEILERALFSAERVAAAPVEVDRIVALSGVAGGRALDLCCGIGRHSIALHQRGFDVTGVDRTERYLARARRAHPGVRWVQGDARTWRGEAPFDLAVNLWTSIGYFDDVADDVRLLATLRANLRPGGVAVVELNGREILARKFQPRSWHEADGLVVLEERTLIDDWARVRSRWIVLDGASRREVVLTLRLWTGTDLRRALESVGFASVALFGGHDGSPYDADARRLVAVARVG